MVGASLLQSDDDSDVPDLDLRGSSTSSRRRHFFSKSSHTTSDYEEIRYRRKTYKTIFLFSFLFVFLVALYFLYSAITRIRLISEEVRELRSNMRHVEELSLELKRVRMQFDVIRESEMERSDNGTRNGTSMTEMIYDKLANISSRFDLLWDGFQKNSMSMEDVTSRMSRVENKCLAVCQQHDSVAGMPRSREQPRRRQAGKGKVTGTDEIVFRRND